MRISSSLSVSCFKCSIGSHYGGFLILSFRYMLQLFNLSRLIGFEVEPFLIKLFISAGAEQYEIPWETAEKFRFKSEFYYTKCIKSVKIIDI